MPRLLYEIVVDVCASLIVLSLMVIGFLETVHWLHG